MIFIKKICLTSPVMIASKSFGSDMFLENWKMKEN